MNQRNVADNATSCNQWENEQPRSEDRTNEGQVFKKYGRPPFFGMVAP